MTPPGLEQQAVDRGVYRRTVGRFREAGVVLPSFSELVVAVDLLVEANQLAVSKTGIHVDPAGSAGLAGLLQMRRCGAVGDSDRTAVLFTGIQRRGE